MFDVAETPPEPRHDTITRAAQSNDKLLRGILSIDSPSSGGQGWINAVIKHDGIPEGDPTQVGWRKCLGLEGETGVRYRHLVPIIEPPVCCVCIRI